MMQGESARQACPCSILIALLDKEMKFEQIVVSVNGSRGTINKYLTELFDNGLVKRKGRRGAYYLTQKGRKKAIAERLKGDIYDLTDSFDTKWLEILRRLLANMRKRGENPEEFFKHQCIAFVGGIPHYFDKSIEGMKYVLRFERDLEDRGAEDGLTKEEYFRKRVKRILKQPSGIRRMLASMGLEEEQIEACLRREEAIEKQGIADVYGRIRQEEELAFETQLFRKFQSIHSRAKQDLRWILGEIPPMERYRLNDIWREEGIL